MAFPHPLSLFRPMLLFAARNLLSRPVRSLLCLLGLTVAIMGMVGLFSVAEGIDAMVSTTFRRVPGLVVMQPGAPIPLFSRLPLSWGDEIARLPGVHVVNRELWARAHVIDGKPTVSPPRLLFGTDIPSRQALRYCVYRESITTGRFLDDADIGTLNVVISETIAQEYGKHVGDSLRIDGYVMTVVGIYSTGSLMLDVALLLDAGELRKIARMDGQVASCFYVEPEPEVDRDQLVLQIKTLLQQHADEAAPPADLSGWLKPGANPVVAFWTSIDRVIKGNPAPPPPPPRGRAGEGGPPENSPPSLASSPTPAKSVPADPVVEVRTADDWADEFKKFSEDLDLFLLLMTGIGVTIAVLSIVNTMLMSVSERIIEFGILKANGWSRWDVLRLITAESALLGVGGGVLGAALGWVGTLAVNARWPDRVHLYASPGLLLFAVAFSIVLGMAGGLYPAIWASRMMPMDAIRRG